jgi:hypothetical protein
MRLGVEFTDVTKNGQAEIAGVAEPLMRAWSKRTAEITKESEPKIAEFEDTLGRPLSSRERISVTKTAVLKTRPPKEHAPESVLHARWRHEAARLGLQHGVAAGHRGGGADPRCASRPG